MFFPIRNGFVGLGGRKAPFILPPGPTPEEQIIALFEGGTYPGTLQMPWVAGSLWQDSAGTTQAGDSDFVGRIEDLSGNGCHMMQPTGSARFQRYDDGEVVDLWLDGIDDILVADIPSPMTPGWTWILAGDRGDNTPGLTLGNVTSNVNGNDYFRFAFNSFDQATFNLRGITAGIVSQLAGVTAGGEAPENTRSIHTGIIRANPDDHYFAFNGVPATPVESTWPPATSVGTGMVFRVPNPNQLADADNARFCANLLIKRELTPEQIALVETTFAARCGVSLT